MDSSASINAGSLRQARGGLSSAAAAAAFAQDESARVNTQRKQGRKQSEEGYILVAVIFMLALFALMMTVAAPEIAKSIQLDRERETMERGKQYVRAIQLYYRKFHAYPPSMDALVKTDNIRFLRKKYTDPMTGKDDWRLIHFGEAKTQTLGFFGQPLAGATGGSAGGSMLAGTGPGGNNTSTGFENSSGLGGGIGSSPGGGSSLSGSNNFLGSDSGGTTGTAGASGSTGSTDSSGNGTSGTGSSSGNGQTFGGAGIIGVAPGLDKQSIMIYKKKDHYNQWEFIYDPLTDMHTMTSGGLPSGSTTTPGNNGTTGTESNSPFGNSGFGSSSNSGFGSSNSNGTSPTTGTPIAPPQ